MTRFLLVAGLSALSLSGCGKSGGEAADDPYSGLDSQIAAWGAAIEATHAACSTKIDGKGCADFQVTCKAAQAIDANERAQGVTAQVVAAMSFNGRTAEGSSGAPGSAFALFSKAGETWTRAESPPVNMSSCAAG